MTTNYGARPGLAVKPDARLIPDGPCAKCGADSFFTVGWLAPTRADACAETADNRLACSAKCAYALAGGRHNGR